MRIAFLDLEDTVVEPLLQGWAAFTPAACVRAVGRELRRFAPDEVHIFSFAVSTPADIAGFREHVQPWLEREIGHKVAAIHSTDADIIPAAAAVMKLHRKKVDFSDLVDFWGKAEAFRLFVRHHFSGLPTPTEVLLIDDAVLDEDFRWPKLGVSGRLVNALGLAGDAVTSQQWGKGAW